jgi:hypothetical protein
MVKLRQSHDRVTAGSGWDWCDLACGVYLCLMLVTLTMTGIGLARGDLPSEKISQQIAGQ